MNDESMTESSVPEQTTSLVPTPKPTSTSTSTSPIPAPTSPSITTSTTTTKPVENSRATSLSIPQNRRSKSPRRTQTQDGSHNDSQDQTESTRSESHEPTDSTQHASRHEPSTTTTTTTSSAAEAKATAEAVFASTFTSPEEEKTTRSSSSTRNSSSQYDFIPKMKFLEGIMDINDPQNELESTVGNLLRIGSMIALLLWVVLMICIYNLSPIHSFRRLDGLERTSHMIVVALQVASTATQLIRPIIRDQSLKFVNSGIMIVMMVIQVTAVVSNVFMLFFPTPIVIDPITGSYSYLIRWAEWIALGFLMTFTTECIDLPVPTTTTNDDNNNNNNNQIGTGKGSNTKHIFWAWIHACMIGICICCGGILAFCTTWTQWMIVFGTAWALFCTLFVRIYKRGRKLWSMEPGDTIDSQEAYDRAHYSFKIVTICTTVWTALAASYSVAVLVAPHYAPKDSIWASKALVILTENFFEVISKVLYAATLVEAHGKVFDVASRTARRLEELRTFMSAVWDTSTDVIVMCTRTDKQIHGVMNPAFFGVHGTLPGGSNNKEEMVTTVIEVDVHSDAFGTFQIDLTEPITRKDAIQVLLQKKKELGFNASIREKNLAVMAELLREAYRLKTNKETTIMKDFYQSGSHPKSDRTSRCEAKVTRLDEGSLLVVIRDISERFKIFETEKKLVEEITARRMDAEANRFTRHEVKNGLLAALGLLDSLRDVPRKLHGLEDSDAETGFYDCLGELDNTIRDILDTVVDHAISREVIYEQYDVRKERIHVPEVLSAIRRYDHSNNEARFPVHMDPYPFPTLGLDPRLLRCIYQSAMTNACVYGNPEGEVKTSISYNERQKEFRLEIVNLPGHDHEKLLAMDHDEVQMLVFAPGTKLHTKSVEQESVTISATSGDGAWMMEKCATTLRGKCELRFENDRTVFSFVCPARAYSAIRGDGDVLEGAAGDVEMTRLPDNTWGVVIDDSGIQRKLMDRFLKLAGIEKEKRIIVGKDPKEIYGFVDLVVDLLRTHKEDRFLVIADENLEVVEGAALHGTVSGSLCVQKILEKLEPAEEKRVLTLVRSANDSAKDLEKYKARAHGYLLKAPIEKKGVLGALQPWWTRRFPPVRLSLQERRISRSDSFSSCESESYEPFHDIKTVLEVIDALCRVCDRSSLQKRWRTIQDRLQRLKGDLQTTIVPNNNKSMSNMDRSSSSSIKDDLRGDGDDVDNANADLESTIKTIDELRFGEFPEDLKTRWAMLRVDIEHIIDAQT